MAQAKPALSLWIVEKRRAQKWKLEELARRLRDAGYEAADTTVRTWEAGRRPSAATIRGMELLFDSPAPVEDGVPGDMAALVRALSDLVDLLRPLVEQSTEGTEARLRAVEAELGLRAQRGVGARTGRSSLRETTG